MAIEMFLRMDGVTGGSRNYHHKGWADVSSWQWGLNRAGTDSGGASGDGMNEIHLTKTIGQDSSAVMRLFAEGASIETADLSFVPLVGKRDQQQKYVAVKMHGVKIKAIKTGGSTEESVFKEELTLTFAKISYEYFEYGAAGTDGKQPAASAFAFSWDIDNNAAG
jgi:type VI secretion system secreted protein Hcp